MIGLILVLLGLVGVVYSMLLIAAVSAGLVVIAWKLLRAIGRGLFLPFPQPKRRFPNRKNSKKRQPRTTRPLSKAMPSRVAELNDRLVDQSLGALKIGNDITIIAGDQTPGMALYSELDPPPPSKLAEN